jgi:hypothetical protein
VKIEYDRRNDESTHGSSRPSRATSFSSLSRQSFNDDESDGEDDMSQRSSMLSRHGMGERTIMILGMILAAIPL